MSKKVKAVKIPEVKSAKKAPKAADAVVDEPVAEQAPVKPKRGRAKVSQATTEETVPAEPTAEAVPKETKKRAPRAPKEPKKAKADTETSKKAADTETSKKANTETAKEAPKEAVPKALKEKAPKEPKEKVPKPPKEPKPPKAKKPKKERKPSDKPPRKTNIEKYGIGLSAARAKNIIMAHVNKAKLDAIEMIHTLAGEEMKQIDFSKVPANVKALIDYAKDTAVASKMATFDKMYLCELKKSNIARFNEYKEQIKVAKVAASKDGAEFDITAFNKKFDVNFYKDFVPTFKDKTDLNDPAALIEMISKIKTRFSVHSKYVLAAFLEGIISQLIENAIFNCSAAEKKTLRIEFALKKSEGYEKRIPLYKFISILSASEKSYEEKAEVKKTDDDADEADKADKADESEVADEDEDADEKPTYNFKTYIADICKYIKMKKAEKTEEAKKAFYENINVSSQFKEYCSDVVLEVLAMMAKILSSGVDERSVKTISETLIFSTIRDFYIISKADEGYDDIAKALFAQKDLCIKLSVANQQAKKNKKETDKKSA